MRVIIALLLVIIAFAANLAAAHKDDCPKSPFLPVAPSDLIQNQDLSVEERTFHEKYMRIALDRVIEVNGKFGAAIVHKNGTLMCVSVNQGSVSRIYHGEIAAIINCTNILASKGITQPTWEGYYLYTTGEPCPMCSAAIMWSKFDKVIFGSYVSNMYCERCFNQLPMPANEIFNLGYGINHNTVLIGGVLESETDKRFPVLCNNNQDPFYVLPLCQEGWNRECPRKSRYFGELPKSN